MSLPRIPVLGVTTGMVIMSQWGSPFELEVAYTIRERFTNPEGWTSEVIRFAGWQGTKWFPVWGGERLTGKVYLVRDLREMEQQTFGWVG